MKWRASVIGIKVDRENHAAELRDALGGLKGPLMKVAQNSGHHSRSFTA